MLGREKFNAKMMGKLDSRNLAAFPESHTQKVLRCLQEN